MAFLTLLRAAWNPSLLSFLGQGWMPHQSESVAGRSALVISSRQLVHQLDLLRFALELFQVGEALAGRRVKGEALLQSRVGSTEESSESLKRMDRPK